MGLSQQQAPASTWDCCILRKEMSLCNICTRFSPQCAIYAQDLPKIVRKICTRLYFFSQCAIYVQHCTSLPNPPGPLTIYAINIVTQQVINFSIFLFKSTGQTTCNKEIKSNQMLFFRIIKNLFEMPIIPIYSVNSFTALKTWIFQDHQNIRKMNRRFKLSVYQVQLINLLVPP